MLQPKRTQKDVFQCDDFNLQNKRVILNEDNPPVIGMEIAMRWKSLLIVAGFLAFLVPLYASGQERTPEEFRKYVNEKLGGRLSKKQLNEIAKKIDANRDGKISEKEFAGRMRVIRQVLSGQKPNRSRKKADGQKPEKKDRVESKSIQPGKVVEIPALARSKNADVLLITGDELAKAWVPFSKWKTAN